MNEDLRLRWGLWGHRGSESLVRRLLANLQRSETQRPRAPVARGKGLLAWSQALLPEHFRSPPSRMHCWLGEQLDRMPQERGTRLNVLGPRGGAKSTLGTLAFVLRAALEKSEPYIWIVSDTKSQATAHLENVKAELLGNGRLAAEYPEGCGRGKVWRGTAIVLRNGVAIESFGAGQRVRGRRRRQHRPTLIVCDDLQNDSHIVSAEARRRTTEWFHGTLLKTGTRRTNVLHLATALHREALGLELDKRSGWRSRVFRAIEQWPVRMDLWTEWEQLYLSLADPQATDTARAFYERQREAMEAGASVLWPEEEDLYSLMCQRATEGRTAFEREKQNRPVSADWCEWPESYFDERIWFDAWPNEVAVTTLALDPSKGADARRGDYSAFVWVAADRQGVIYVDADLERRPVPRMVEVGVSLCERVRPDVFVIETNQFQELLAGEFSRALIERGLLRFEPRPLENRVNKGTRVRRLAPLLARGRVRFRRDSVGARLLVEQLREFPLGAHDDGPDALEMAIRAAGDLLGAAAGADGLGQRLTSLP